VRFPCAACDASAQDKNAQIDSCLEDVQHGSLFTAKLTEVRPLIVPTSGFAVLSYSNARVTLSKTFSAEFEKGANMQLFKITPGRLMAVAAVILGTLTPTRLAFAQG
jgi:hypothetical protein